MDAVRKAGERGAMKAAWIAHFVVAAATAAAGAPAILAADSIAWGPADNGIRVGIDLGPDSPVPTLRLSFQNTGAEDQDLLLGGETGTGPMYSMKFKATKGGKECEVFYFGGANFVAGHLGPLVVRLAPGATHELQLPLKRLACSEKGKDTTLDALLDRKYSVRVSLEVSAESASWSQSARPESTHRWIGKMTSAEFATKK